MSPPSELGPAGTLIGPIRGISPNLASSVFVAKTAVVVGQVTVGAESSIWYGSVLRGDEEEIVVGKLTNIQDGVIVHTTHGQGRTVIGDGVTVGHRAMLHGCQVGDGAMIGIAAVVLDGAVVEPGAMVAAGAVVTPGTRVAGGELWAGCPARRIRELKPGEIKFLADNPAHYRSQALAHGSL